MALCVCRCGEKCEVCWAERWIGIVLALTFLQFARIEAALAADAAVLYLAASALAEVITLLITLLSS